MKIAIIGATGRVGTRLIDEALRRGHGDRTAQGHLPRARAPVDTLDVDVADGAALAAALAGQDVAISTVRFLTRSRNRSSARSSRPCRACWWSAAAPAFGAGHAAGGCAAVPRDLQGRGARRPGLLNALRSGPR